MPVLPIDYNPFATQYRRPTQQPARRMVQPPRPMPQLEPGLERPWQPEEIDQANEGMKWRQHAQSVTDYHKDRALQSYLTKALNTLPANDPRRAFYSYLQKLHQTSVDRSRVMRQAARPVPQIEAPPVMDEGALPPRQAMDWGGVGTGEGMQPRPKFNPTSFFREGEMVLRNQRARPPTPRVGDVVDGYTFLGGDPRLRHSWAVGK